MTDEETKQVQVYFTDYIQNCKNTEISYEEFVALTIYYMTRNAELSSIPADVMEFILTKSVKTAFDVSYGEKQ